MKNTWYKTRFIVDQKIRRNFYCTHEEEDTFHGETARQCANLCEIIEEKFNRITFDVGAIMLHYAQSFSRSEREDLDQRKWPWASRRRREILMRVRKVKYLKFELIACHRRNKLLFQLCKRENPLGRALQVVWVSKSCEKIWHQRLLLPVIIPRYAKQ
jgi:hypothetical protein